MNDPSRSIVPLGAARAVSQPAFGSFDGRVLSAIACVDSRMRGALFIVRVLNSSSYPVFCSIYGENARGISALRPYEFRVDAGGTEDAQILVPRRAFSPFTRAIVSMRGAGLEYRIEARVPPWRPPAAVQWSAAAVLLAAALLAARIGNVSLGEVPQRVQTGHVVSVRYDVFGIGSARYTIVRDGKAGPSAPLEGGSGTLSIASGDRAGTLAIGLTLSQAGLDRTTQSAPIAVETPPPPPQIQRFELETPEAYPGDRVRVKYAIDAQSGTLSLLDAHGTILESRSLQRAGTAVLIAPAAVAPASFALRLDAQRGGAHTASTVQFSVAPEPTLSPVEPAASAQNVLLQSLSADEFVGLEAPYAVGGGSLHLRILRHDAPLSLALQNPGGRTVATTAVTAGEATATLAVPHVQRDSTYLLVVTLQTGQGEQSLLMPVAIHARP